MFDNRSLRETFLFLVFAFLFCAAADAQEQAGQQRETPGTGGRYSRVEEPADLARENLGRVAASPAQIRGVLVRDEGLLVELKRWVGEEATDNGQVVDDSTLRDQAIFDRLELDTKFRSVATR